MSTRIGSGGQLDDESNALRHRHRTRDLWFGLCHVGRVVEDRVCHERGQFSDLVGGWLGMVEADGLLLSLLNF